MHEVDGVFRHDDSVAFDEELTQIIRIYFISDRHLLLRKKIKRTGKRDMDHFPMGHSYKQDKIISIKPLILTTPRPITLTLDPGISLV